MSAARRPLAHERSVMGPAPRRGERGAIGGLEALPFSVLIFVAGTLLLMSAWAVIDTTQAAGAAAREGARALSESTESDAGRIAAERAAAEAFAAHGGDPSALTVSIDGDLRRCGPVRVRVRVTEPAIAIPLIGGLGPTEITASHTERVESLRSGLPGEVRCD